jgi:hypothetical protein
LEESQDEFGDIGNVIKSSCILKSKDIILETVNEYMRKGNFVRIYPGKNSNMYDSYFNGIRPLNKLLYKVFFSDKLMKYETKKIK